MRYLSYETGVVTSKDLTFLKENQGSGLSLTLNTTHFEKGSLDALWNLSSRKNSNAKFRFIDLSLRTTEKFTAENFRNYTNVSIDRIELIDFDGTSWFNLYSPSPQIFDFVKKQWFPLDFVWENLSEVEKKHAELIGIKPKNNED